MRKRIRFYGITVELELSIASRKDVSAYIQKKLEDTTFYIQKKRNGSYIFYYEATADDDVPTGYYTCEFSINDTNERRMAG